MLDHAIAVRAMLVRLSDLLEISGERRWSSWLRGIAMDPGGDSRRIFAEIRSLAGGVDSLDAAVLRCRGRVSTGHHEELEGLRTRLFDLARGDAVAAGRQADAAAAPWCSSRKLR